MNTNNTIKTIKNINNKICTFVAEGLFGRYAITIAYFIWLATVDPAISELRHIEITLFFLFATLMNFIREVGR